MCLWLFNELKRVEFGSTIERAVILALADVAGQACETWIAIRSREPDRTDLECLPQFKKRAIGNAIQRLEKDGWLIVNRVKGKGNGYFINRPASRALQLGLQCASNAPAGAFRAPKTNSFDRSKGSAIGLQNVEKCPETQKLLPPNVTEMQWVAYLEVRGLKGLPCTFYVLSKLIAKLFDVSALGGCAADSLDAVINNGWPDIRPETLAAKHPKQLIPPPVATDIDHRIGQPIQISKLTEKITGRAPKTVQ